MTDKELLELAAKKREKHGMRWTPEYQSWLGMKQRCSNPKKREFQNYGGRGIRVCPEWTVSFSAFFTYVGNRPTIKHSLDRIDVNGDYEPGNVRWATQKEQIDNTTVVKMVTINGRTQSQAAWGREMGLSNGQITGRIKSGWGQIEAIVTPSIQGQKLHKFVPKGYTNLKTGWFRVQLDGKYIKTVKTEIEAIKLVAIVRAAAELAKQEKP